MQREATQPCNRSLYVPLKTPTPLRHIPVAIIIQFRLIGFVLSLHLTVKSITLDTQDEYRPIEWAVSSLVIVITAGIDPTGLPCISFI